MDSGTMGFLLSLVIATIIVFPLGGALRRHPMPFYLAAVAATGAYVWMVSSGVTVPALRPFVSMMQKGFLASIMIAAVMFCGCFDEGTAIRKKLQPIRGELSILSFIFILGHLLTYAPSYLSKLSTMLSSRTDVVLSLVVALTLTILFAILSATSLRVVRFRMNARVWKCLQRGAYVMVALLAVHVALMLGRSAILHPGSRATIALSLYLIVIAAYVVLRIRKWHREKTGA